MLKYIGEMVYIFLLYCCVFCLYFNELLVLGCVECSVFYISVSNDFDIWKMV